MDIQHKDILKEFYEQFKIKKIYLYKCRASITFDGGYTTKLNVYLDKSQLVSSIINHTIDNNCTVNTIKILEVTGHYPNLTDDIYLQLIAIVNNCLCEGLGTCCLVQGTDVDEVKIDILKTCIRYRNEIQDQIKHLSLNKLLD